MIQDVMYLAGAGLVVIFEMDGGTGSEAARTVPTAPIAAAERNHRPTFISPSLTLHDPMKQATLELTPIR